MASDLMVQVSILKLASCSYTGIIFYCAVGGRLHDANMFFRLICCSIYGYVFGHFEWPVPIFTPSW